MKNQEGNNTTVSTSEAPQTTVHGKIKHNTPTVQMEEVETPKGKKGKKKRKSKQDDSKKKSEVTKPCLSQSSLVNFGITNKRTIDQATSPDGLSGSPEKKELKTKT